MTNSRNRRALKVGSGLAALAGLALIVVLIAYQGVAELGRVLFGAAVCLFGMSAKGPGCVKTRVGRASAQQ